MNSPNRQVLIVGAGPSGLMAAAQLLRWGIQPRIVEANPGPSTTTKAVVLQARSAEIYQQMGLGPTILAGGFRVAGANMYNERGRIGRLPLGDIGTGLSPFPFLLTFGQDRNERLLGEFCRAHGVEVEWNTRLEEFGFTPNGVRAVLSRGGQTESAEFRYLLAADGARSTVRRLAKLGFGGTSFSTRFWVMDARVDGEPVEGEVNLYAANRHMMLGMFAMPGERRFRAFADLPRELEHLEEPTFEDLRPFLERYFGHQMRFSEVSWFADYRVHHRVVEKFRLGNVLILGDAAHVHTPVGGQGMNTGLQDAYNLAWKLALVLRGEAEERLLDTYHEERHANASSLVRTIDTAFRLIATRGRHNPFMHNVLMPVLAPFALRFKAVQRLAFRSISQIGVQYKAHSLSVNRLVGRVKAGERFPWFVYGGRDVFADIAGTRFTLFALGDWAGRRGELEALRSRLLEPVFISDPAYRKAGLEDGLYLVRPDGYIGLCTDRPQEVSEYLTKTVGLLTPKPEAVGTARGELKTG